MPDNAGTTTFGTFCIAAAILVLAPKGIAAAAADRGLETEIKPRVCVVIVNDTPCAMELEVSWSSSRAGDLCLKVASTDEVINCWRDASAGQLTFEYSSSDNVVLQFLAGTGGPVIGEEEVKIVSRDLRDSRRRRRHVWSIL